MLPPYHTSSPKTNTPHITFKQIQKPCQTNPDVFQTKYEGEIRVRAFPKTSNALCLSAVLQSSLLWREAQKGWFVNTFVDCMIAKIIPATAGRWAMHAASDPQQPNAADSAIGKKEKKCSAIGKKEKKCSVIGKKKEKIAQLEKRKKCSAN